MFDGDKLTQDKTKELFATKLHSHKDSKALANEWIEVHFNEQVEKAISKADHFAYEEHFREDSTWSVIDRFKSNG